MGKQINYYMEYEGFIHIVEKALKLGCEIIRDEHADKIIRGFSAELVTPECKWYFFHVPEAGEISWRKDMYGKFYVDAGYSASGNSLIEAGYSYISAAEKRISRARLFCITGFYDENEIFISRPECMTKIYNALVRCTKKIAPYTELSEKRIRAENTLYEHRHKEYITEYCQHLLNEGYSLQ